MRKQFLLLSFATLGLCGIQTAAAHSHTTYVVEESPTIVLVENEPPAELAETMEACPGPEYIWVKGRWTWDGRWIWTKGCWMRRPHTGAVWVPGYWKKREHHHHCWAWVEGRWE